MANNKEEAGKGTPRPGEMPGGRRTYATLDLTAAEVEGKAAAAASGSTSAGVSAGTQGSAHATSEASSQDKSQGRPEDKSRAKSEAMPNSRPDTKPDTKPGTKPTDPAVAHRDAAASHSEAPDPTQGAPTSMAARLLAVPWLPHLASGALGALLVLIVTELATTRPPPRTEEMGALGRRVANLETTLGGPAGEGVRARIEELGRSMTALSEGQTQLARDAKMIASKLANPPEAPPELVQRLSKLEEALSAGAAADPATQSAQVAALSAKLSELEKSARGAADVAKSSVARLEAELSSLRADAGGLSQRLDLLKSQIEERLKETAKAADFATLNAAITTLEREVATFRRSEADRAASANANATHMLLALELANLKRAIDRGQGYADELARVKKLGGFSANFVGLERHMQEGAPPVQELAKSFRKVADAMLDAEAEPADATLMDRLLSGARSIVRVRKAGHADDDMSLEAIVSRMEAAVKDGRLGDVLANAKKLPPKAALTGEDWIRKVEARQAVDQAMAEVETELKAALGGKKAAPPEDKR
jgi:hypothetical protein